MTIADQLLALPDWLGFLNAQTLLTWFGGWAVLGICIVLFIETGLLFPLLPGDSLLFVAGMLVAQGSIHESLALVGVTFAAAAFLGDQCSYLIGHLFGHRLFRPGSRVFKPEYLARTTEYFERFGGRTVVLARFVPIVRTYAPAVAGMSRMRYRAFIPFNAIGALLWAVGVTVLGYFLGQIGLIKNNIEAIFVVIVLVSVLPIAMSYWSRRRPRRVEVAPVTTALPTVRSDER